MPSPPTSKRRHAYHLGRLPLGKPLRRRPPGSFRFVRLRALPANCEAAPCPFCGKLARRTAMPLPVTPMTATIVRSLPETAVATEPRRHGAAPVTLSVVIPMYNEAANLDRLFTELEESLAVADCSYEIV